MHLFRSQNRILNKFFFNLNHTTMDRIYFFSFAMAVSLCLASFSCNNAETDATEETTGDRTGVTDSEIAIGSYGPLTGPAALWGNVVKGTDAYFRMINEEGGINGRKIKFIFRDDEYNPSKTVTAVRELVQQEEVFAIAGGVGTATNMSVAGFLEENRVPWITPMSGAAHWTQPPKENIYSVFPLYVDEGQIMAEFAIDELQAKKVGVIYVNDDFGKSGLAGVKYKLQQNDMDFVAALPVEPTDTDLSSHVARLKESGAEVVFLWVTPRHAAIVLGTSAVVDFKPHWMASMVLSDMALMHDITKGAWEGVYFTYVGQVLPTDESSAQFMKYKAAFNKYYPEDRWGTFAALGFSFFEPMVEGLKRAGEDLSRESFLEAMAGIQDLELTGGIPVSFSKDKHLGTRSVSIMRCKSATEAERITDMIPSSGDVQEILTVLNEM